MTSLGGALSGLEQVFEKPIKVVLESITFEKLIVFNFSR
ncbi:hypothetical protein OSCI_3850033 [Kamptonema sp. PCC 6506]|nr:hypothetical protein OSCI_3850033 [Kamptonema sp. PCC 6506]